MKKKVFVLVLFLIIVLTITLTLSKQQTVAAENDLIKIITTIYPYEILVRQIAGERAVVKSFIPPGASPHTYSPTPDNMKMIERADLVISNGMDLEVHIERILSNLADRHIEAAMFLPELAEQAEPHDQRNHNHEHAHHHRLNPHIWLDPVLLLDIAKGITERIVNLDPDYADYYRHNYAELETELVELDQMISEERQQFGTLDIINFHDAFHYFNKRYDINTVALIVESPGKEPTPRELVRSGRLIEQQGVSVIFLEPQLNPKAAEIIAREHNIRTETLDPLGDYLEAATIRELIMENWNRMKRNFIGS